MKSKAAWLGLVPLVCLVVFSAAATAAGERVLITDRAVLESMGFPSNATNVYGIVNSRAREKSDAEADFGTGSQYTSIAPKSFIGRQNTGATVWEYSGGDEGCCANLSRKGTEEFADGPLTLPNGVLLDFVRFWANDSSAADDMGFSLFESCYPTTSPGATSYTVIVSNALLSTTGFSGNQSNTLGVTHTIDNRLCTYTLRVRFEGTTDLTLQKMRAQWRRQISPAPAVASFDDVGVTGPTSQFFREVEALAASGITSGCDADSFCPENFVTRRQMAAFLARALGL